VRRALPIVPAVAAIAAPTALAKGKLFFEDDVRAGKSSWVEMSTHRPASFRVVLRVPTQGRAQLVSLADPLARRQARARRALVDANRRGQASA
jgi:hypothetical protein